MVIGRDGKVCACAAGEARCRAAAIAPKPRNLRRKDFITYSCKYECSCDPWHIARMPVVDTRLIYRDPAASGKSALESHAHTLLVVMRPGSGPARLGLRSRRVGPFVVPPAGGISELGKRRKGRSDGGLANGRALADDAKTRGGPCLPNRLLLGLRFSSSRLSALNLPHL